MSYLYLMLGGALGAGSRYFLSNLLKSFSIFKLPAAVLSVNVIGSFLFGVLIVHTAKYFNIHDKLRIFIFSGFLASFTTYSTFAYEFIYLLQNHNYMAGISYLLISIILPVIAMAIGMVLVA